VALHLDPRIFAQLRWAYRLERAASVTTTKGGGNQAQRSRFSGGVSVERK
jgi:hypothetical protein